MADLVAFLNARLDEDEALARRALNSPWQAESLDYRGLKDEILVIWHSHPEAELFLRHDPARVLREVEAKRAILAEHGPDLIGKFGSPEPPRCLVCLTDREGYEEIWEADPWPCATVRALAAVYRDRPDYQDEWKP